MLENTSEEGMMISKQEKAACEKLVDHFLMHLRDELVDL